MDLSNLVPFDLVTRTFLKYHSVFLSVSDLSNIKEKIDSEKEIAIYLLDILYLKKYFGFVLFNCYVLTLNI